MTVSANTMPVDEVAMDKKCSKCGEVFPATAEFFHRDKKKKDGLVSECKKCRCKYRKGHYEKNKATVAKRGKRYYEENKEAISKRAKRYREENKDAIAEYRKGYLKENNEALAKRGKRYYEENKEQFKRYSERNKSAIFERQKRYREENKDAIAENKKRYYEENKATIYQYKKRYYALKAKYKSTIINKLKPYEKIRQSSCGKYAEIQCAYCGKWIIPTISQCIIRNSAIAGTTAGECRIYCNNSEYGKGCREACPTYGQILYPKGFRKGTSREVLPELRQMVFEHDDYTCQRCHITIEDAQLHAHHIKGAVQEPMLANDVSNVITLCKACHKMVHKQEGCSTHDYRRAECAAEPPVKRFNISMVYQ